MNISLLWSQKKHIVYPQPPPHSLLLLNHIRKSFLSLLCCFIHISKSRTGLKWSFCDWRFYCSSASQRFTVSVTDMPTFQLKRRNVRHKAAVSLFPTVLVLWLQVYIKHEMTNILFSCLLICLHLLILCIFCTWQSWMCMCSAQMARSKILNSRSPTTAASQSSCRPTPSSSTVEMVSSINALSNTVTVCFGAAHGLVYVKHEVGSSK